MTWIIEPLEGCQATETESGGIAFCNTDREEFVIIAREQWKNFVNMVLTIDEHMQAGELQPLPSEEIPF